MEAYLIVSEAINRNFLETAEREVLEETGIVVTAQNYGVHAFDTIVDGSLQYVVVDVLAKYVSGQCNANDDVDDAQWVDRYLFDELDVHQETRNLVSMLKCFD